MTYKPSSPPPTLHKEVCETPDGYNIDLRALKSAPIFIFLTLSNIAHVFFLSNYA